MSDLPLAALILAGGYGTRFRPLTFTRSKPLIEFCNIPIIRHILDAISFININKIVIALNVAQHDIYDYIENYKKEKTNIEIYYSFEEDEMGTAGAIAHAKEHLVGNRVILFTCDSITTFPLNELLEFHKNKGAEVTLGAARIEDGFMANVILEDENHCVTGFNETPSTKKKNCLVHSGFSVFEPNFMDRLENGKFSELKSHIFDPLIQEKKLFVYEMKDFFVDMSELTDIINGIPKYVGEDKKSIIDNTAILDPTVEIGNSVVIGANCKIGPNTKLDKCVILPNTTIGHDCNISNSIIGWKNKIGDNVIITDMCVLGEKVTVESDTDLTQFYISPYKVVNASNAFIPLAKIII